jgi:uncharacterized protein
MSEFAPAPDSSRREPGTPPAVDRSGAARQPRERAVMRQNWRNLLFLHWPIRPERLRALVPRALELDLFDDTAYVGLVPFTMTGVRPVGLPAVWGVSSFHETNLRTYVRLGGRDPGVWFFNLEAASSIAVRLARRFFHLPYHYARMLMQHESASSTSPILYAGVRRWPGPLPASYAVKAVATGPIQPARTGTLEHFLVERYILYTVSDRRLYQGRVCHTPYPLQTANLIFFDENLLAAAGLERPEIPPLAHFSSGVDVDVLSLTAIDQIIY